MKVKETSHREKLYSKGTIILMLGIFNIFNQFFLQKWTYVSTSRKKGKIDILKIEQLCQNSSIKISCQKFYILRNIAMGRP